MKVDPLRALPPEARADAIRQLVDRLFGPAVGARVWEQMQPALASQARQLGDARTPADNYWRGAWRIYECE